MTEFSSTEDIESAIDILLKDPDNSQNRTLLKQIILSKLTRKESAAFMIAYINDLLSRKNSRKDGLFILELVINYCSLTIININKRLWINACLEDFSKRREVGLANFTILNKLVKSLSYDDFDRSAFLAIIKTTINMSISTDFISLDCLTLCMQRFPAECNVYRNKIESYLLQYLTYNYSTSIIRKAGTAFSALQQVGLTRSLQSNWVFQIKKLCLTMHNLYNDFLPDLFATEMVNVPDIVNVYEFEQLSIETSAVAAVAMKVLILRNLTTFISSILQYESLIKKDVEIFTLLNVIIRGLSAYLTSDSTKTIIDWVFNIALYTHHIHLLHLLESFIIFLSSTEDLHCVEPVISKLIVDCLQYAQRNGYKDSEYQLMIYKVLSNWIVNCNNISKPYLHKLLLLIIYDITPRKRSISLSRNEDIIYKEAEYRKSNFMNHVNEAALKCGIIFFTYVPSNNLDEEFKRKAIHSIIHLLLDILENKVGYPYTEIHCQKLLYRMFIRVISQTRICCRTFMVIGMNILVAGQKCVKDSEVAQICQDGINILCKTWLLTTRTFNCIQQTDQIYSSQYNNSKIIETNNITEATVGQQNCLQYFSCEITDTGAETNIVADNDMIEVEDGSFVK